MSLTFKDLCIVVQNAANVTGSLLSGTDASPERYKAALDKVVQINLEKIAEVTSVAAFPGAEVQAPPSNVVPFPPAAQAPAPAAPGPIQSPLPSGPPAAIPGATNVAQGSEDLWRDLFANPGNWDDVRASKRADNSPDFTHKTQYGPPAKNGKQYKLGLWISGRDTPAWVHQAFSGGGAA